MRVNFDVLMILDALDRHGSFATAAESLYKTPRRPELYDPEAGERSEHRAVGSFRPSGKIYRYRPADAGEGATAFKCRQRSGKAGPAAERGLGARASHRP